MSLGLEEASVADWLIEFMHSKLSHVFSLCPQHIPQTDTDLLDWTFDQVGNLLLLPLQEQGHVGSHPSVPVDIIHYSRSVQPAEMRKVICKNTPLCYQLNRGVKLCEYSRPAGLIASRAPVSALILFRLGCPVKPDQIISAGSCVIKHVSTYANTPTHSLKWF